MSKQVLVIGGGGREHALAWKLAQASRVDQIFVAPGNGGTAEIAENVDIKINELNKLLRFAKKVKPELTIVGEDLSLALGVVDLFTANGLRIFGPTQSAAQIESSKAFSKELMNKTGIPTAGYQKFSRYDAALRYTLAQPRPVVIKASGLTRGKGVVICQTDDQIRSTLEQIMQQKIYGSSGEQVIIEEYVTGREISLHAVCSGTDFVLFPPTQDNKPLRNGGQGPNTAGIGTIGPVPWVDQAELKRLGNVIVHPVLDELARSGHPFTGCLYPGLKGRRGDYKVLEYNARFGDPEAEVYVRLMDFDLYDLLDAACEQRLNNFPAKWSDQAVVNVVLCSGGYPGEYRIGLPISGLAEAAKLPGVEIFQAGTKRSGTQILTNGGRVLHVTAMAPTMQAAHDQAYAAIKLIHFEGMHYRTDIGAATLD